LYLNNEELVDNTASVEALRIMPNAELELELMDEDEALLKGRLASPSLIHIITHAYAIDASDMEPEKGFQGEQPITHIFLSLIIV
jgi:hypothetical protein